IVPFNTLSPDIIEMIVGREIKKINAAYEGEGVSIAMSKQAMKDFIAAKYNPETGARGPTGYINAHIESKLARTILANPDAQGVMEVHYDHKKDSLEVAAPKKPEVANDVGEKPVKSPISPSQAFKLS